MNTKYYELKDFTSIHVSGVVRVNVVRSQNFNVSAVADNLDYIKVEQNGDTLVLGRRGIDWLVPFHMRPEFRVEMPELTGLKISGACQGDLRGFASSRDLSLDVSGASHVELNGISAANVTITLGGASHVKGEAQVSGKTSIEIQGASHLTMRGSAGCMKLDVSGASHADLAQFQVGDADVSLSGASHAAVDVTGKMNTELDGASKLDTAGSPQMGTVAVNGASSLHRK